MVVVGILTFLDYFCGKLNVDFMVKNRKQGLLRSAQTTSCCRSLPHCCLYVHCGRDVCGNCMITAWLLLFWCCTAPLVPMFITTAVVFVNADASAAVFWRCWFALVSHF